MKMTFLPQAKSHHPSLGTVAKMLLTTTRGNYYGMEWELGTNKQAVSDNDDAQYEFVRKPEWCVDYGTLKELEGLLDKCHRNETANWLDFSFWTLIDFIRNCFRLSHLGVLETFLKKEDAQEYQNELETIRQIAWLAEHLATMRSETRFLVRMKLPYKDFKENGYYFANTCEQDYFSETQHVMVDDGKGNKETVPSYIVDGGWK